MTDFPWTDGAALESAALNDVTNVISVEAGETIAADDLVYIHLTNGEAYVSDTGTADDIRADGIALSAGNDGDTITVQIGGSWTTTGLTAKQDYYLGAAGALSTTLSGVRIGTALSTTSLYIKINDQRDTAAVGDVVWKHISMTGYPANNITAYFMICSGGTISDTESILNGQAVPDLTGTNSFIRGNTTSGGAASPTHSHATWASTDGSLTYVATGGWTSGGTGDKTSADAVEPDYVDMVPYIKIK